MCKSAHLNKMPLIAILRGVRPEDVLAYAQVLYEAGFRVVEVPLNSPRPYESIIKLADSFGDRMRVGAGTVVTLEQVRKVKEAGGEIIVSPNVDTEVIRETKELGMYSYPGIMTISEGFQALKAGADALKLFPADVVGKGFIKASKAIFPAGTEIYAVGGVNAHNMGEWVLAGADGFGLGSCLYKPSMTPQDVKREALELVSQARETLKL